MTSRLDGLPARSSFCSTAKSVVPSAAGDHHLAINDRRFCLEMLGVGRNLFEAVRPVVAPARENLDALVRDVKLHAVAIEFYLVDPLIAVRHLAN
jgi:hypothetical protein